jgi:hypothetical protein
VYLWFKLQVQCYLCECPIRYYWAPQKKKHFQFLFFLQSLINISEVVSRRSYFFFPPICYSSVSSQLAGYTTKNITKKKLVACEQKWHITRTSLDYFPCNPYFPFSLLTRLFITDNLRNRLSIFISEIRAGYYLNRSLGLLSPEKLFCIFLSWTGEKKSSE